MNTVIATTGTGGDLFPGIAVAESLRHQGHKKILFVISGLGPEEEVLRQHQFSYERIRVGRLRGRPVLEKMNTLFRIPLVLFWAVSLLKKFEADLVLGSGGYSSGPVVLAAWFLRIPRAVIEPNSIPGLTNRLLTRFANLVFTSFPGMEKYFPARKVEWLGTPTRSELKITSQKQTGPFTLLVLGGSQGASSVNEAILKILPGLRESGRQVRLIHQTGRSDFDRVRQAYSKMDVGEEKVEVSPFIQDMKRAYSEADLVISRAGGSTIAELVVTGRPALFIPYPHSVNQHQRWNAMKLVERGAAEMIPDQEIMSDAGRQKLLHRILHYEADREDLRRHAEAMRSLPGRDAAERMALRLVSLVRHV
ncbi:MAG: undecaprenyldiphospho-muramoylpentapeptide beta-N-acetylglucosaminyltransferase [Deltaproteobacteria bacterium]|nr:undecaprenyldiphospho-muramoylpentapeptide beta-N-acetylglucosaminyltransferase [Deltaproteobacteria bacterium]